jgi:hypothetical protein
VLLYCSSRRHIAQLSTRDERDFGKPGAMSAEELRKERVRLELDIPYADTGNSRHRLDLIYLKGARASSCL